MKKIWLFIGASLLAAGVVAQTLVLEYPLSLGVQITELPAPVMALGPNGRWSTTIQFDVRNSVGYADVGVVKKIDRLVGSVHVEISAKEINTLLGLPATNKYAPGEWDAKALQAGFMKAMLLLQSEEQKEQYAAYWNQVEYDPIPVTQVTEDANGEPIVAWTEGGDPVIGYDGEDPVLGAPVVDKDGIAVVGMWRGLPVIGYDANGYPQTSAFE